MRYCLPFAFASIIISSSAQTVQAAPKGFYDPTTGNLIIADLPLTGGLQLVGPGVPATSPDSLGGFADTSFNNEVSWLLLTPLSGDVELGPLLPSNLHQKTIEADYFAGFVPLGAGGLIPIPITGGIIPEPSTLLLSSLGLVGLAFRRRRNG